MPNARSFFRVVLVWLFRAAAFLLCVRWISSAVRFNSFADGRSLSHQLGISAAIAVCTWHSVSSGFFPPEFLSHPRQEQVAHATQNQVAFQSLVTTPFVLIQPDLRFLILETTLDSPARETHQQQLLDRRLRGGVAHEELHLLDVQDVASHHQVHRFARHPVLVLGGEKGVLELPDHRPLLTVLDPPALPRLISKGGLLQELLDPLCRAAAAGQPRNFAATPSPVLVERPRDHARWLEAAGEAPRDLAHELLVASTQASQEVWLAAVSFVEGHPVEVDAILEGMVIQLQGD